MQRIALTKASPGMVLAQAVSVGNGPVLVGEGLTLTEEIIGRMRAKGVSTIYVEGNPLGPSGTVGNLRAAADRLPYLFRRQKDNVFMMTLCDVFARQFARRIAEQRAREDAAIERGKEEDGAV
ncbi:hypothetical protein FACS1894206_09500 [Deltaproteobacteria bacterium]|nr:hypothetical protein FACS1894206_09500 [Deltaproteobacteria bacterium]